MTGIKSVFAVAPRVEDPRKAISAAEHTIAWSSAAGADGVLHFTGAGAFVDPFVAASLTFERSENLIPFIALNPAYHHPVAAARWISSMIRVHGRSLAINLVTGASVRELSQLGQTLAHDERYDRLIEFAEVVTSLLSSVRPLTFHGVFYHIEKFQLQPELPPELLPQFFVAGASEDADTAANRIDAQRLEMLPSDLAAVSHPAVHFGVIVGRTTDEAWTAAHAAFPDDREGRLVADAASRSTDAVWQRNLLSSSETKGIRGMYWIDPVRNGQADCPYVVGSEEEVGDLLESLSGVGVDTVVIDLAATGSECSQMTTILSTIGR